MSSKKAQELSLQTIVVLIMVLIVLVIVIAFVVPQLTGMFGGLSQLGNSTLSQLNTTLDLNPNTP